MAYYNKETKKIYNCKKNSMVWWHEKGHQYLDKNSLDLYFEFGYKSMFSLCVLFLCLDYKRVAIYTYIIYFFLKIGEEIGAWIFALMNIKRWVK